MRTGLDRLAVHEAPWPKWELDAFVANQSVGEDAWATYAQFDP